MPHTAAAPPATDSQRARVYAAEADVHAALDRAQGDGGCLELHNSTLVLAPELRFGRLEHVQSYLDAITRSGWFGERWPQAGPVRVRARRGDRRAHYERPGVIALCASGPAHRHWALREMVVLHELAHHVSDDGHGPSFVAALLTIVEQMMGPATAFLLSDSLRAHGVRWSLPVVGE